MRYVELVPAAKADSDAEGVEKHAGVRVRAIPFAVCHACHRDAPRLEPALQPPPQRAADRCGAAALVKACCFYYLGQFGDPSDLKSRLPSP